MKFEVRKGSFRYKRGKEVLKDIDFSLEEACILSVLGANGAGKTTLLKCMLGLLPWSRGGSYLDGNNIREIPSRMFWRHVGYVPQAKPISFVYTVREMVVLGRNTHLRDWEQPSEEDWKIVDQCLERVGIQMCIRDSPSGALIADDSGKTAIPGVFAAGDVRRKALRQIVTAVSDGAQAALSAEEYLSAQSVEETKNN